MILKICIVTKYIHLKNIGLNDSKDMYISTKDIYSRTIELSLNESKDTFKTQLFKKINLCIIEKIFLRKIFMQEQEMSLNYSKLKYMYFYKRYSLKKYILK